MRKSARPLFVFVVALLGAQIGRAEKLVSVLSVVDPGYAHQRGEPTNAPKPQTYVFAKGPKIFGSDDPTLKKTDFTAIASTLAFDLKQQHFEPTDKIESADLVIVVSWGVTAEREDGRSLLQYDPDALRQAAEAITEAKAAEEADATLATRVMGATAAAEATYKNELRMAGSVFSGDPALTASNADLLGFRGVMSGDSDMAETVRSMADEARYFIVLMAYDGAALRGGKKQRLWITRMSIRAAGVNFPIALNRMSSVAARYNGAPQPGIVLQDSKDRPAIPVRADLKVLGSATSGGKAN